MSLQSLRFSTDKSCKISIQPKIFKNQLRKVRIFCASVILCRNGLYALGHEIETPLQARIHHTHLA